MGLLDDAIREHLELKRLRGADPGEVARAEKEALDPVPRERQVATADGSQLEQNVVAEASDEMDPAGQGDTSEAAEAPRNADLSDDPGETAELDMQTLLQAKEGAAVEEQTDQDLLEWESLGKSTRGPAAGDEQPEQGAASEDPAGASGDSGGPARATADAARPHDPPNDAPEQKHLWS